MKQFGFTADTVPVFVRGVLSMQNMKYSKDYAAWMANAESLDALLEAKSTCLRSFQAVFLRRG